MAPAWLLTIATLSCAHARRARERLPEAFDAAEDPPFACPRPAEPRKPTHGCAFEPREITAFGGPPRDDLPDSTVCPMHVRAVADHVVAEPARLDGTFDALPFMRCPPFVPVARRVVAVDGGYLVSEIGITDGELLFVDESGRNERRIARGRFGGFARAPSGAILALASGRAHLGRGAVLRLEERSRGEWRASFVAVLPLEPATVALDDGGAILAYAERFVFRVDETGKVENLHFVSRDLGRVASIARTANGAVYLGVECGVLRIAGNVESWWSARDGASGRWRSCRDPR